MKKMERKLSLPVLGGSSLLVIFGVLCLTVLAMLSLDTALAQQRLSRSTTGAIAAYYKADLEAERLFAELRGGRVPEGVEQTGDLFSYACPITPRQSLQVELKREADGWQVLRWQAVAEDIVLDEQLPVWMEEK